MAETAAQKRKREKDERAAELAELGRIADGEKPTGDGTEPPVVVPDEQPDVVDAEVEQARLDDEYDTLTAEELVANLGGRGLEQDVKDRLNAALAEMPNDPEVLTDLLRRVVKALDRGEDLPVPTLPVATDGGDDEGTAGSDAGVDAPAGVGADDAPSAPAPDDGDDDHEGPVEAQATADQPEALPFADLGHDELIALIHEEGGAAALDNLNQAIQFLSTEATLPYLRRFLSAVVDEDPMPNLEPHLVEEAARVAAEAAGRFKITSDDDEPGAPAAKAGPPPLQRPELGEDLGGFRVGEMVRVAVDDPESIYNGHVGFVERAGDEGGDLVIRFHQPQEDPGDRVPAAFPFGALTKADA